MLRGRSTSLPPAFVILLLRLCSWSVLAQSLDAGLRNTTGVSSLHRLYFSPIEHRKVWAGRGVTATSPGSQTDREHGGQGEGA